ncbi:MAG: 30S ribosomal protein S9 [Candidatus Micrarchaeota archaeon]|nr:30S ribosomal protein S9 [Candidatus Micrarchaeota archaeon]
MANEVQATATEAQAPQPAAAAAAPKKKAAPRKSSKKGPRVVFVKSKRKAAIARASVKEGNGRIRINSFNIETVEPKELRRIMMEPISVSSGTKSLSAKVNIDVSVNGGGISAQAQAVRGAIAKGIAAFSEGDDLKREYMKHDRSMIVDDFRRVEPKKFKGPKARARFQKSYR